MPTSVTGEDILQSLIRRAGIGQTLLNADIGSIAAGNVTAVKFLRNAQWPSNYFQSLNALVYRPSAASAPADLVRYATTVASSTGVLSIDSNWADTTIGTENIYLLYYGIHPQWIVDAMNRACRQCYFPTMEPLSAKPTGAVVADAGMQKSVTTSYVESDVDSGPATTFSKVTTADSEHVYRGIGSGRVVNTEVGGYIRQRFNVSEQEQVIFNALSQLDSGTNVQAVLQDVTNTAAVGSTITHSQHAWTWTRRIETVPSACKILEARLGGAGASDDLYVNAFQVLFPMRARMILDTTWETEFEIPSLAYLRFDRAGIDNLTYPADSAELIEIPRGEYDFDFERPGANPSAVQFHNNSQAFYFQNPVYIQGRRAYSDLTTFTTGLSETTTGDLDLITSATWAQLLADPQVRERVPGGQTKWGEANFNFQQYRYVKRAEPPAQKKRLVWQGLRN